MLQRRLLAPEKLALDGSDTLFRYTSAYLLFAKDCAVRPQRSPRATQPRINDISLALPE